MGGCAPRKTFFFSKLGIFKNFNKVLLEVRSRWRFCKNVKIALPRSGSSYFYIFGKYYLYRFSNNFYLCF